MQNPSLKNSGFSTSSSSKPSLVISLPESSPQNKLNNARWERCQSSLLSAKPKIDALYRQLKILDKHLLSKQAENSEENKKNKAAADTLYQAIHSLRKKILDNTDEQEKKNCVRSRKSNKSNIAQ